MSVRINVLAELDRVQCKYTHIGNDEIKIHCPFHNDTNPTCHVNVDKQLFNCFAAQCNSSGDFFTLLAGILKTSRDAVVYDLGQRYVYLREDKIIASELIEKYHEEISKHGHILKALRDRGINHRLIKQYRIGYDDKTHRITIPIKNYAGIYVNIRKYMPGAEDGKKFLNIRGHSEPRLFPIEQLKYDKIVICGGELKAIAAAEQLNSHGVGAVSTTCGEGVWNKSFTKCFAEKKVWLCYDIDKGGRIGANNICGMLYNVTESIQDILLPLNPIIYPKGDISDYVGKENGELLTLLESAPHWEPALLKAQTEVDNELVLNVKLADIFDAQYITKLVTFPSLITGNVQNAWAVPKKVCVDCPRNRDYCSLCSIISCKPTEVYEIKGMSPRVLEMVNQPDRLSDMALREYLGIPSVCKASTINIKEHQTVKILFVQPPVNMQDEAQMVEFPVYCLDSEAAIGDNVQVTSRVLPHPKNQTIVLLSNKYDELNKDTLDDLDQLKIFRPHTFDIKGINEYLNRRYTDFELNVTNIYCRHMMHLIMDLTYHSALTFKLGRDLVNGWMHTLILGDTSQGKSKTFDGLKRHYGLGNKLDCKNASAAGILGGVSKYDNTNYVRWGAIVQNDRGLVCLEEAKYMASREIIGQLTNTFSEGIARIEKICSGTAYARTRVVLMSNPIDSPYIRDFNYGVRAIAEIMGCVEDVRRLDIGYLVSQKDIDQEKRYQKQSETVEHVFTASLCRKLILWVWSRQSHQIIINDSVHQMINDVARELAGKFSDTIPLVDSGSMREKVARLATSLAAMTFSTDTSYQRLIIQECHVEFIRNFYFAIYGSDQHGYATYSKEQHAFERISDIEEITQYVDCRTNPKEYVRRLIRTAVFTVEDWKVAFRVDPDSAIKEISYLLEHNCVELVKGRSSSISMYKITPAFRELLRKLQERGLNVMPKYERDEF